MMLFDMLHSKNAAPVTSFNGHLVYDNEFFPILPRDSVVATAYHMSPQISPSEELFASVICQLYVDQKELMEQNPSSRNLLERAVNAYAGTSMHERLQNTDVLLLKFGLYPLLQVFPAHPENYVARIITENLKGDLEIFEQTPVYFQDSFNAIVLHGKRTFLKEIEQFALQSTVVIPDLQGKHYERVAMLKNWCKTLPYSNVALTALVGTRFK